MNIINRFPEEAVVKEDELLTSLEAAVDEAWVKDSNWKGKVKDLEDLIESCNNGEDVYEQYNDGNYEE